MAGTRSDEQIQNDIDAKLNAIRSEDAEQIQVDVIDGQVTLVGTVEDHGARDRADTLIRGIEGVTYVVNNLRVAQAGTTGATG